jgi:C-terminal processing protease CtpA/Prc
MIHFLLPFSTTTMPSLSSARYLCALTAIAVSCSAHAAQGRMGFSIAAETDGMFSTTLKAVKISAVVHDAPAEQAGLLAGDDVQSVNDVPVAGTSGPKIMDMVHAVQPGEHLRLKVKRGGAEHLIDIVAGAAK